jgi:N-acetylneuraminic acid mutarotase
MNRLCIVWLALILTMTACGGGDSGNGGGSGSGSKKQPQIEHQMFRCTIHRRFDGLTGLGYWTSCPNDNWNLKSGQPLFAKDADCWAAVDSLKKSDPEVYDNSQADRDRGWAQKLWCLEPDETPPAILFVSPKNESSGFPIDGSRLRADFSDNMDKATITASSFTLEDSAGTLVPGIVDYNFPSRTAIFTAEEPLQYITTYTARLTTDITDKVGNSLVEKYAWSFTTEDIYQPPADETAPQLIVELPSTDSTCAPEDAIITARFDEPIAAAAGAFTLQDSGGALVDGTVTVSNTKATFTSTLALQSNEVYTARLSDALTDIAGNTLTPSAWSFRTELAPEGNWTPIATPTNLAGRAGHTAVWTGSEMLIWGGYNWENPTFPWFQYLTDGARYEATLDQWINMSKIDAPQKREQHTATWTGTEMIVWGGVLGQCSDIGCLYSTNTGGRYDPATDTWQPMSTDGAPSRRRRHTAIWTGSELIIWGGVGSDVRSPFGNGARYNPVTDTWSPLSTTNGPAARGNHKAVFDGQRMIVWSGESNGAHILTDGAIYDPASDVWTSLPSQNAPGGAGMQDPTSVVSTGTDMFVRSPENEMSYDQFADEWYASYASETRRFIYQDQQWITVVDACNPRATPNAVWLKGRFLGWNSNYSRGELYDEALDTWAPIAQYPNAIAAGATVVVAGHQVIIWGGRHGRQSNGSDSATNVGYRLSF